MKKLIIFLVVAMIAMFSAQAMAIDAGFGIGSGVLVQKGFDVTPAFTIAAELPIVNKSDSSYSIKLVPDFVYCDREEEGVKNEMTIARAILMYEKVLHKSFTLGLGSGVWKFINTNAEDNEYPALRLKLGAKVFGVSGSLTQDLVRINKGADMYYTTLNIAL